MQCPKCGTVQPDAEICTNCQIVISKYRQRQTEQQSGGWGPPSRPIPETGGGGLPIAKILVLLLIVAGVAVWGWWTRPFSPLAGKYDTGTGLYRNDRFEFELVVPPEWKTYTVKEAISCATINREYADQYFLLASPTQPTDEMLVVHISGIELASFKARGWDGVQKTFSSRHPVRYTSEDEIGGIQLYRIGYEIGSAYREDSFFEANGKLMQIYFYVTNSIDSASKIVEMRRVIDSGLRKL